MVTLRRVDHTVQLAVTGETNEGALSWDGFDVESEVGQPDGGVIGL